MELWEVAKHLGVTGGPANDKIINDLRDMEDRDQKEAVKLGNIGLT